METFEVDPRAQQVYRRHPLLGSFQEGGRSARRVTAHRKEKIGSGKRPRYGAPQAWDGGGNR
jgi:hypothetical protein